jgi:hypothetical protein
MDWGWTPTIHQIQYTGFRALASVRQDLDFLEPASLFVETSDFILAGRVASDSAADFPTAETALRRVASFLELRLQTIEWLFQFSKQEFFDERGNFGHIGLRSARVWQRAQWLIRPQALRRLPFAKRWAFSSMMMMASIRCQNGERIGDFRSFFFGHKPHLPTTHREEYRQYNRRLHFLGSGPRPNFLFGFV